MQQQNIEDQLLQQLRHILSFPVLSRNNFLLKKFDPINGCIRLQCLVKENSIRQLLEHYNSMQVLVNILIQYNYSSWAFDSNYSVITPIFVNERKQVQVLIKRSQVDEFKKFLQELEVKQEWEPKESDYLPNKDMIKLFVVFETEEDAQIAFSKIQQTKANFGIQNAKMEAADYFAQFLQIVVTKQQQYHRYDQQKICEDPSPHDIVSQRLHQIRANDKIELNYAPVAEQPGNFFMPQIFPQQPESELQAQPPITIVPRETESNKENSVERNNERKNEEGNDEHQYKRYRYQDGYQYKRRNYYDQVYQSKYNEGQNNRKPHHYNRLEDDLREFTGYKKYQQRPQKEYYEPKKES